jgi:hypothetical protein
MAMTLHEATAPSYLQVLAAVRGFLQKGLEHARTQGLDPEALVESRIHADMLPLRFQVVAVCHFSRGAYECAERGEFAPPKLQGETYQQLIDLVAAAEAAVRNYSPDAVNAIEGRDVVLTLPSTTLPFAGRDFLLSFAQPNFYFHATTAYDILRMNGVPLGKRDFLGQLRLKAA